MYTNGGILDMEAVGYEASPNLKFKWYLIYVVPILLNS